MLCESRYLLCCGWYDRYSDRKRNSCYDGRNPRKPAKLPLRSITKRYGVTHFTELHHTLHKNFLIWRRQILPRCFYCVESGLSPKSVQAGINLLNTRLCQSTGHVGATEWSPAFGRKQICEMLYRFLHRKVCF